MRRGLAPILLTLVIVAIILGLWFAAVQEGFFFRKSANDISLCRIDKDKISLKWKDRAYKITGWHAERSDSDVLHIDINITRSNNENDVILTIDTINVNYLEIYGDTIPINEVSVCR